MLVGIVGGRGFGGAAAFEAFDALEQCQLGLLGLFALLFAEAAFLRQILFAKVDFFREFVAASALEIGVVEHAAQAGVLGFQDADAAEQLGLALLELARLLLVLEAQQVEFVLAAVLVEIVEAAAGHAVAALVGVVGEQAAHGLDALENGVLARGAQLPEGGKGIAFVLERLFEHGDFVRGVALHPDVGDGRRGGIAGVLGRAGEARLCLGEARADVGKFGGEAGLGGAAGAKGD